MKKITYLMNVHWNWIKQRPHFLAEELSEHFQMEVFYQKHYRTNKVDYKPAANRHLTIHELFRLPADEKIGFFKNINFRWMQRKLKSSLLSSDIIWYSKPDHALWFPPQMAKGKVRVYDCMDDMLSFPEAKQSNAVYERIFKLENEIVTNAEIVLASSDNLAQKLEKRYKLNKEIHVVNNAMMMYSSHAEFKHENFDQLLKNKTVITYVGTIAEWFDFNSLIKALDKTESCVLILFGPASVAIPHHDKIFHFGSVEHKYIPDILNRSKVLILPFLVDELIEAVNPVKMYEYIYSGNTVLASKYGETLKFGEYAHLYSSGEELIHWIETIDQKGLEPKKPLNLCREFGSNNTWNSRAIQIKNIIESYV